MSKKEESSLTTPSDRNKEKKAGLDLNAPPLNDEQTMQAVSALNQTGFVEAFPQFERRYQDPPVDLQVFGLISFVPAKGATPNKDGIYGFAKLRGNYATEMEANARSEFLIRNVDSYHKIFHAYVGRPFPMTDLSDFSKDISKIDIQKATADTFADDIKKKRDKEQKEIAEIEDRQKELLEDVKKEKEDPDDRYTTLRVKKAQLTWTYFETEKKMKQMKTLIAKARKEVEEMEAKDSSFRQNYFERYMKARKQAGITTDPNAEDNFIKFLVDDISIPEVDAEYNSLYGENNK